MGEWISVKDRLPDQGGYYIVFMDYNAVEIMRFRDDEFTGICGFPTHWMPLPEPPK